MMYDIRTHITATPIAPITSMNNIHVVTSPTQSLKSSCCLPIPSSTLNCSSKFTCDLNEKEVNFSSIGKYLLHAPITLKCPVSYKRNGETIQNFDPEIVNSNKTLLASPQFNNNYKNSNILLPLTTAVLPKIPLFAEKDTDVIHSLYYSWESLNTFSKFEKGSAFILQNNIKRSNSYTVNNNRNLNPCTRSSAIIKPHHLHRPPKSPNVIDSPMKKSVKNIILEKSNRLRNRHHCYYIQEIDHPILQCNNSSNQQQPSFSPQLLGSTSPKASIHDDLSPKQQINFTSNTPRGSCTPGYRKLLSAHSSHDSGLDRCWVSALFTSPAPPPSCCCRHPRPLLHDFNSKQQGTIAIKKYPQNQNNPPSYTPTTNDDVNLLIYRSTFYGNNGYQNISSCPIPSSTCPATNICQKCLPHATRIKVREKLPNTHPQMRRRTLATANFVAPPTLKAIRSAVNRLYRIDDFEPELLGTGFFSEVFKVTHLQSKETMVLKVNKQHSNRCNVLREIQLMNSLSHPNILRFLGVCVNRGQLHALTEYINGGNLEQLILDTKTHLSWALRINLAIDITKGMKYLHGTGIFHRDLTSKNCFIRKNKDKYTAIVGDLGLAAQIPKFNPNSRCRTRLPIVGSPYWMAPECLQGKYYDEKADIFSFGIILCEMIARIEADPDILPRTMDFGLDHMAFTSICPEAPIDFLQIAFKCCLIDPDKRPPSFTVIFHSLKILCNNNKYRNLKFPYPPSFLAPYGRRPTQKFDLQANNKMLRRAFSEDRLNLSSWFPETTRDATLQKNFLLYQHRQLNKVVVVGDDTNLSPGGIGYLADPFWSYDRPTPDFETNSCVHHIPHYQYCALPAFHSLLGPNNTLKYLDDETKIIPPTSSRNAPYCENEILEEMDFANHSDTSTDFDSGCSTETRDDNVSPTPPHLNPSSESSNAEQNFRVIPLIKPSPFLRGARNNQIQQLPCEDVKIQEQQSAAIPTLSDNLGVQDNNNNNQNGTIFNALRDSFRRCFVCKPATTVTTSLTHSSVFQEFEPEDFSSPI